MAYLTAEANPKAHLKRLKGSDNPLFYSFRDYRAILSIIDDLLVINVIGVGRRSKIYRKF